MRRIPAPFHNKNMPEESAIAPPEGGVHPPNPLIRNNSLEEALRREPNKKKSAVLAEVVSQIDDLLRKATDDGIIWGASISILGDLENQCNKLYLPLVRASDSPKQKNKVSIMRRASLAVIASLLKEASHQIMEFFGREMEVRVLPEEAEQTTVNK